VRGDGRGWRDNGARAADVGQLEELAWAAPARGPDTSTTAGKAMFQMLGVFAEFERAIIRERVNAGRPWSSGTVWGRHWWPRCKP
jgi:Resolvase, N terminal domain